MNESRLVNRNITAHRGRTSMRLEPELWDALEEICHRESMSLAEVVQRIEAYRYPGGRTSAVRVHVLGYFRDAATEAGHRAAGHGEFEIPPEDAEEDWQPDQASRVAAAN